MLKKLWTAWTSLLLVASADDVTRRKTELQSKFGQDYGFTGINTFAHLLHVKCLLDPTETFDIAIIGIPFDTAVTYRTGARFGPRAIRAASSRQTSARGYNARAGINPYKAGLKILDCGDVPVSPFDNALALRQMTEALSELNSHAPAAGGALGPRLITLGGDHSIALAELRALRQKHRQPITVLHLDAHLDTWYPATYGDAWFDKSKDIWEEQSAFTHGTMFWLAHQEGLIAEGSVHAGLRTRLSDLQDNLNDTNQGWVRYPSDTIHAPPDGLGPAGLAEKIMGNIGDGRPVFLSIDIDVIDPGLAPGTGTPEPGGWSTRELIILLRANEGLNLVGADVVEVSPAYDGSGEQTALAAAQVVFEILTSMAKDQTQKGDQSDGILRDEL